MTATRCMTLEEAATRMAGMITPEGVAKGIALKLRPTDVVVSPYGKSGTTWTQQIVHTLRTRGDMDFDDISRVVPWIETSHDLGIDLEAEQRANPRAFKSHLSWDAVPKGGKYIVPFREPGDALYSAFKFQEGWFIEPGAVSLDEFAEKRFLSRKGGRDYWTHLLSWWSQHDNPDVMLLTYEGMKADLPGVVRRIAAFIGVALDPELEALTLEHASLGFMTTYKDRFDDSLMRERSERVCGLPPGSDSAKVREGKVGSREVLSSYVRAALEQTWQEAVTSTTGFADYAAFEKAVRSTTP
ncbi:MAG: sulfotransferase domain-containing protein [Dehalococcoidia bacterium]